MPNYTLVFTTQLVLCYPSTNRSLSCFKYDRADRHEFWPSLWLFFSLFLFSPKQRGMKKRKMKSKNRDQKSCLSARSLNIDKDQFKPQIQIKYFPLDKPHWKGMFQSNILFICSSNHTRAKGNREFIIETQSPLQVGHYWMNVRLPYCQLVN